MGTFAILGIIFSATAVFAIGSAPFALRSDRRLAREGLKTTGKIIGIESDMEHGYHARIEIMTPKGLHTFLASTQRDARRVGEVVPVRYLPDRPDEACIDAPARIYGRTIVAATVGAAFALAGAVMFILHHQLDAR